MPINTLAPTAVGYAIFVILLTTTSLSRELAIRQVGYLQRKERSLYAPHPYFAELSFADKNCELLVCFGALFVGPPAVGLG